MAEVDRARETSRLFRVWRTVFKMLLDRGYMVSQEEANISREDFEKQYTNGGNVAYGTAQRRTHTWTRASTRDGEPS